MNASGLYTADQIRNVNELRMRARWKLGQLLAPVERGQTIGPGRGHVGETVGGARPPFIAYLEELKLKGTVAKEAQRIGALPAPEFDKALAVAHKSQRRAG
jgi:hypothetical protein